jgi:Sec63 Brl domain
MGGQHTEHHDDDTDIIHSAAILLEKCQLVNYERSTGHFTSTDLGRIASYYYVTYNSMMVYNQHLRPTMSTLELFRVFALSSEFKLLPVWFYCLFFYSDPLLLVFRSAKRHVLNSRSAELYNDCLILGKTRVD